MKSLAHIVLLAAFSSLALCLAGCANSRYAVFGCVSARASLESGGLALYTTLTIEPTTNKPAPPIYLRFPNGQVMPFATMTLESLNTTDYTNLIFEYREPGSHSISVDGSGARFDFANEKLARIYLTSGAVSISREDNTRYFALPMSLDDLEHLFGRPDEINTGTEW
jgi:hypothetical protein